MISRKSVASLLSFLQLHVDFWFNAVFLHAWKVKEENFSNRTTVLQRLPLFM